ncbi:Pentatricopeptide repeat-containing protein [Forsythia ovata]|uniref:Pentatricopeptide repeat-containing protein n=1 Tax=Forsythia ovata TaxID=205694 RepID=A0ABD1X6T1_9LAMI
MTILHFPEIHGRRSVYNATKAFNFLFSRAPTTPNHQPLFVEHSSTTFRNSIPLNSDYITQLLRYGSLQNPYTINEIVSWCAQMGSLSAGIQLHCHVLKTGFANNVYISTSLIYMYGKCGENVLAHNLFVEMPNRNAVTWNSLISGYVNSHYPGTAIELFFKMLSEGIAVTPYTVSSVLVGCSQLEDIKLGVQVHGLSLKAGFGFDAVAGSGLIDMYAHHGNIEDSRRVFDRVKEKNIVIWNSMITGYAQNQCSIKAMILFRDMLRSAVEANYVTYNSLLSSFCSQDDLDHCKQIHCCVSREGLESNMYLATTLMTVYSSSSCSLGDFYNICCSVTVWDQIAWNAVIAGFSNLGIGKEAILCFSRMRQEGITVDFFTFTSLIKALGCSSSLEEGKQIHALVLKTGFILNKYVQNGLVSMYGKCGKIDDSKKVFSLMDEHDVISWNSLLTSCAQHGYGREAIQMFEHMRRHGIKPNLTTFLAILTACSHVGLLEKGLEYFDLMKSNDFLPPPKLEHYASVVDLYGRAGYIHEAEALINSMPIEPGPSVYKALLSACQVHGNKEIAVRSARKLVELCPNDPAIYVLLANVLATEGSWNDAASVRKLMCHKGVRKEPGYSWV